MFDLIKGTITITKPNSDVIVICSFDEIMLDEVYGMCGSLDGNYLFVIHTKDQADTHNVLVYRVDDGVHVCSFGWNDIVCPRGVCMSPNGKLVVIQLSGKVNMFDVSDFTNVHLIHTFETSNESSD